MNTKELGVLFLGILAVVVNMLTFQIPYNRGLQNGINWHQSCEDVTVSESLLLLSGDAGFGTGMAVTSAVLGAILLYIQFSNHSRIKYILPLLYLMGLIFFSTLPFVVIGHLPQQKLDPLPNLPNTDINQIRDPMGHKVLAFLYGFCMCMCFIISTWVYYFERDRPHKIALCVHITFVFCLLISFLGSMIYMSQHEKDTVCKYKDIANRWFSITEFLFLFAVSSWLLIIASPFKIKTV
jgi:glucan phosphoethanolaminetransferase (alkaline phosphatase superfamily)